MSSPFKDSFHTPRGSMGDHEPYHDDPSMRPKRTDDVRSPAFNSPLMSMSDIGTPLGTPLPARPSFRSSVGLIPTPGTVSKRHPTYEPVALRFWVVVLGCALLAIIGVALEVALGISNRNDGALRAFLPSLVFAPLAFMVHGFDWAIRMWNVRHTFSSRGNASADETLLIDYPLTPLTNPQPSRPFITYNALKFRHQFVLISGTTALATLLFQPLAGSIFSIRQLPKASAHSVYRSKHQSYWALPDINDLTSFASSAGVSGWATAEFIFPTDTYLNGSMSINTTGIQTNTNCAIPNQLSVDSSIATNWTLSAYLLTAVRNVPDCGVKPQTLLFNPTRSLRCVFCQPRIQLFDVTAFASLNNGSLTDVKKIANYCGKQCLKLIFNNSANINVQSRANAIRSGIPGAIFRQAQQAPGGIDSVFQDPKTFVDYTTLIYTRHLSLATKSNYFVRTNNTVNAVLTQLVPRLYVEPVAAHALAMICLLTAPRSLSASTFGTSVSGATSTLRPPGSIGSAVALTSHSGFGELLMPYDNALTFSRALAPLRFRLDRRTGAIVVDDSAIAYAGESSTQAVRDETMMTLIGRGPRHRQDDSLGGDTSRGT
ncbi:hypothetical protein BJY52DRAFT_1304974 [Lactarius psammicola]|nr:hypothetical protein BJY52DRAFT_1304974 [Lactarius psammicola]